MDAGTGFDGMWAELAGIGRDPASGGYRRFAWTAPDLACREWFTAQAKARGMAVERDRNGNLWAWLGDHLPGPAIVTGSHLDSVPDGGAYDGPLGIVSAFAALDALAADGWTPPRPVAVVAFTDEEGARFGVPCIGSRLLTGTLDPARAAGLRDGDGITLAQAMRSAGADPAWLGADRTRLSRIGAFVELHVEQGRYLANTSAPVAVGSGIGPHGRWRLTFRGRADHAGTTALGDRADPMLAFAASVQQARTAALHLRARATVGKVTVRPNGTNAIPSEVNAWLDARGSDEATVRAVVTEVLDAARQRGAEDGVSVDLTEESWSPAVTFGRDLGERVATRLGGAPVIPTGAGHDAGILAAAGIPTTMLFVRNPTGVSHAPDEHAETADCHAGVAALAAVLTDLASDLAADPVPTT
ncbi:allantoate amidohydrolase [Sporichthya polymorpha]|uniref:allantoate amidohydrolase n=1 Tax=Sporichthya polymorpha TaxID=35751 RepID=UPI00037565F5|nr:allantoate amidohydrolase [Sporichthya polymorpha]